MKSMQAREFRTAMNDLTEPVEVYARADKKGTWYPVGFESPQVPMLPYSNEQAEMIRILQEAQDEIARLKRELAARPMPNNQPMAITDARGTKFVNPAKPMSEAEAREWVMSLPEQDRAFFASRLGIKLGKRSGASGD